MRADGRALAAEVTAAFTDTQYPVGDAISQNPENDEGTADYFRDKSWHDIPRPDLIGQDFALVAFTPAAFAYFLPAFLIAGLESPDHGPLDSLIFALTPPKNNPKRPSYWRWWSLLSPQQRRVVIKCLRHWDSARSGALSLAATSLEATVDA
jgi:hypothetical protein